MSEKPQQAKPGTPEIDMLNDILDRAMPSVSDSPEEEAPDDGAGSNPGAPIPTEPPPEQLAPPSKTKPSSVYVYLAVLFGAAFLMLLLAYFVQQRNNDAVQDDLELLTASRQELLDNIKTLEEENESLRQNNELLNLRLEQVKEEREALKEQADENYYSTSETNFRIVWNNELNYLERFIGARDWLMAGVVIEAADPWFNERHVEYWDERFKPTDSQIARYFELREEVLDKGRCMAVERTYSTEDRSEYTERPRLAEDAFAQEDYETAQSLLSVILYYPNSIAIPAGFLLEYFPQASSSLERIDSGAFKPSTVELYQQVRADVLAAGKQIELNGELADVLLESPSGGPYDDPAGVIED